MRTEYQSPYSVHWIDARSQEARIDFHRGISERSWPAALAEQSLVATMNSGDIGILAAVTDLTIDMKRESKRDDLLYWRKQDSLHWDLTVHCSKIKSEKYV